MKHSCTERPAFRLHPLAVAVSLLPSALAAQGLPTGLAVARGQATVTTAGPQMTINNSDKAILNWQSFSIGANHGVHFQQPGVGSQVLNRVVGNDPSSILGSLSSNGKVWLLNPNGVLFGQGARVDVAGLVASTLNLNDTDWLAGRWRLDQATSALADAGVTNRGALRSLSGGQIMLLGSSVRNEGLIEAPGGQVLLAAGKSIELVDTHLPNVGVRVTAPAGAAVNLGQVLAPSGRVDLAAAMVNQQGIVRADSLGSGPGGAVQLQATQAVDLAAGSVTSADGAGQGGSVSVDAGREGRTLISGEVSATASAGRGGQVTLLGQQVGLLDSASVNVSGSAGGGDMRVGGGVQGRDATVPNAQAVFIAPGAHLTADATQQGDGGRVIAWSDQATRAYGHFSARGGAQGGNGGLVETSGGWLDAQPANISTQAPKGQAGQWLLDPYDITIADDVEGMDVSGGPVFQPTGDGAVLPTWAIENALNAGNNVTITTGTIAPNITAADITMSNAHINVSPSKPVTLTMTASRNVVIDKNSAIEAVSPVGETSIQAGQAAVSPLNVVLNAAEGGTGSIWISDTKITTANGNITLGGNRTPVLESGPIVGEGGAIGFNGWGAGIRIGDGSTLNAGLGQIKAQGYSVAASTNAYGVYIAGGAKLSAADVGIKGRVDSDGNVSRRGVIVYGKIDATHSLDIAGEAFSNQFNKDEPVIGTHLAAGSSLELVSAASDSTARFSISGISKDGDASSIEQTFYNVGLFVSRSNSNGILPAKITVKGNVPVSLNGTDLSPHIDWGVSVQNIIADFSEAGSVNISAPNGALGLSGSWVFPKNASVTIEAQDPKKSIEIKDVKLSFNLDAPQSLDMTSAGSVFLSNSLLEHAGAPLRLSIDAERNISVSDSTLVSNGSALSSWGFFANRNVSISGSSIVASGAGLDFNVDAGVFDGKVLLSDTKISTNGGDIYVFGDSNAGAGVELRGKTTLDASMGEVYIGGLGSSIDGSQSAAIYGVLTSKESEIRGSNIDVYGFAYTDTPSEGEAVAAKLQGKIAASGSLSITGDMALDGTQGGGSFLGMALSGNLLAAGPINIFSNSVILQEGASIQSTASGDAITLAGTVGDEFWNIISFRNDAGPGVLDAPMGRWLIYASNPADKANFSAGGLRHDFTQYNAAYKSNDTDGEGSRYGFQLDGEAAMVLPEGNGLLFSVFPSFTIDSPAITKVYDGTVSVSMDGLKTSGLINGDHVLLQYIDRDAGVGKSISATFVDATDKPVYGYSVPENITGNIEQKSLSLEGFSAANKVYDGKPDAVVSGGRLVGVVGNETINFSTVGNFNNPDAQTGKTVTVNASLADGDGGGLAKNYKLAPDLLTTTADIQPKPVTANGFTAANKTYDGTDVAAISGGSVTGVVGNETLSLGASGSFNTKDVGTGKTVTVTPVLADGTNGGKAGNYQLDPGTVTTTADITPKVVTASGFTAANKTYDGTTTAAISGGLLNGVVGSETLGLGASGSFDTKDAGNGKTVTVTPTLTDGTNGGLASNYTLGSTGPLTTTADITPRLLTFPSPVTADNKVYDGTTEATVRSGSPRGLVGNETVTVGLTGRFDTKDVGTGKTVTVTPTLTDGSNGGLAGNYTLGFTGPFTTTADITPRLLTLNGLIAEDKVYDATTAARMSAWSLAGVLPGETVSTSITAATFDTPNAGTAKPVTAQAGPLVGMDAGNYVLSNPTAQVSAAIAPATLAYVATPATMVVGSAPPSLSGTVTGFVGGDTLATGTVGTLAFTSPVTTTSAAGSYAIQGSGLSAANYVFSQAEPNATALTVLATPEAFNQVSTVLSTSVQQVQLSVLPTSPSAGRALDALQGLQPGSRPVFQSVPVSNMTREQLEALIASRDAFKQQLFAESIQRLEQDPGLADVRACETSEQVFTGRCLITEAMKTQLESQLSANAPNTFGLGIPSASNTASPHPEAPSAQSLGNAANSAQAAGSVPTQAQAQAQRLDRLFAKRAFRNAALPQIERKLAVLIGIDRYADTRIPQLENAAKDAKAVAATLESTLGYETLVIENGTKDEIVAAFNELALLARSTDSVVVYYAGHGALVPTTGLGYWQPADADPSRPESWLSNRDIAKLLAQIGASQVALVSDSCYSGSLLSEQRIRGNAQKLNPDDVLKSRATVVMSSGGNEPVFDSGKQGHSTFAWNLMQTLQQVPAWQAGGNVFERVRFAVAKELPQKPQYGVAPDSGHKAGADYLFEKRELEQSR